MVVSHNETALPSLVAQTADQIVLMTGNADVVCIDEAQFFDARVVDVANSLANDGKRVIVAGLDMDYLGRPFGAMPYLMAIAEYVTKLHAICSESGMLAHYSQRIAEGNEQHMLGDKQVYEPRSRACFRPPHDVHRSMKSKQKP
jgi:thymidine kinase